MGCSGATSAAYGVSVSGNIIETCSVAGISIITSGGASGSSSAINSLSIGGNLLTSCDIGVLLNASVATSFISNFSIAGNTIAETTTNGVHFIGATQGIFVDFAIASNVIDMAGDTGYCIRFSQGATGGFIASNYLHNGAYAVGETASGNALTVVVAANFGRSQDTDFATGSVGQFGYLNSYGMAFAQANESSSNPFLPNITD
jgi:hypothetical protein